MRDDAKRRARALEELLVRVVAGRRLSRTETDVLRLVLSYWHAQLGFAFPDHATLLARMCGVDPAGHVSAVKAGIERVRGISFDNARRGLRRVLASLEAKGLLVRHASVGVGGVQMGNEYEVVGLEGEAPEYARERVFTRPRTRRPVAVQASLDGVMPGVEIVAERPSPEDKMSPLGRTEYPPLSSKGVEELEIETPEAPLAGVGNVDAGRGGSSPMPAATAADATVKSLPGKREGLPAPAGVPPVRPGRGRVKRYASRGVEAALARRAVRAAVPAGPWEAADVLLAELGADGALVHGAGRIAEAYGVGRPRIGELREVVAAMQRYRQRHESGARAMSPDQVVEFGLRQVRLYAEMCGDGRLHHAVQLREFFRRGLWEDTGRWPWRGASRGGWRAEAERMAAEARVGQFRGTG